MIAHVIVAAIAASIAFAAAWQVQADHYDARIAQREAEVANALRGATEKARRREQELQRYADEISKDAVRRQQVLASRVATTDLVARGLRDDIARLNGRASPADPTAARFADAAARARELLGACAAEYRGVAGAADGLRDQVIGLQDWARGVVPKEN